VVWTFSSCPFYSVFADNWKCTHKQLSTNPMDEDTIQSLLKTANATPVKSANTLLHPHFQPGISRCRGPCLAKSRGKKTISLSIMIDDFPNSCQKCCRGKICLQKVPTTVHVKQAATSETDGQKALGDAGVRYTVLPPPCTSSALSWITMLGRPQHSVVHLQP